MSSSRQLSPLISYSLSPDRYIRRVIDTSVYSIGRALSELSIVSVTSARPSGGRPAVPAKMTSSIFPPRSALAPCSPSTQAIASTTLDLPEPFGPTTQVMPGSKRMVVAEAKDLKPFSVRLFRCTGLRVACGGWPVRRLDCLSPRTYPVTRAGSERRTARVAGSLAGSPGSERRQPVVRRERARAALAAAAGRAPARSHCARYAAGQALPRDREHEFAGTSPRRAGDALGMHLHDREGPWPSRGPPRVTRRWVGRINARGNERNWERALLLQGRTISTVGQSLLPLACSETVIALRIR